MPSTPFPPVGALLEPQHPQHPGKYGTKLTSNPQQTRNKSRNGPATKAPAIKYQLLAINFLRSAGSCRNTN